MSTPEPAAPVTPEPAPATPAAPAAPAPLLGPDGQPYDPERQQDLIRKLRAEIHEKDSKLTAAQAAEAELAAIKQAQETEAQRIQREKEEAEQRAAQAAETAAAATAALQKGHLLAELAKPEHGIVDVQAAAALLTGVQYDDQGKPTNLTTSEGETPSLLQRFLAEKPYLKATPATPAPTPAPVVNGGGGSGGGPGPSLTAAEVKAAEEAGMSAEDYAAFKNVGSLADYEAYVASRKQ